MARNRRKHARVRARNVGAQLLTAHGRISAQVENISRGGVFVRTDRPLEVGSDVLVELVRPGLRRALTLAARVTSRIDATEGRLSRRMPGMGMQFVSLDARQDERLLELLHELGAPNDEAEVTLADDATEQELQALVLDDSPVALDPDPPEQSPQITPSPVRGGVKFELPRHLADDLAGILDEFDPPRSQPPPPPPPEEPQRPPAAPAAPEETLSQRLMVQIRGLVMQLADAQQQISQRDLEVERMREELENAREARDGEILRLRKDLENAKAALERALRHG
ncbi:MAG TPA: PilZ domain-containing protein [Myxococcales bacterium]|jgi:type IV pilus assembly protein PilZ|nr:PilZ domain-containing protein [Myxococcales bacterium]